MTKDSVWLQVTLFYSSTLFLLLVQQKPYGAPDLVEYHSRILILLKFNEY